jgi:hypothetical protein
MSTVNKSALIPRIPKNVLQLVLPSENVFVLDADGMIEQLNVLSGKLPHRYGWRYRTTEAFNSEMREIAPTEIAAFGKILSTGVTRWAIGKHTPS